MKTLNLSEGFNPFNSSELDQINYKFLFFSGGEPHFDLKEDPYELQASGEDIVITTRINNGDDLLKLISAVSAIDHATNGEVYLHLLIPYMPGAREDRVQKHTSFMLLEYARLINSLGFRTVGILDPHSDVTSALVANTKVIRPIGYQKLVANQLDQDELYVQIIPDAGAAKKAHELTKHLPDSFVRVVQCGKNRDVKTGELSGFEVYADDLHRMTCVVFDDICDGGGTFIGLADELRKKGAGKLILVVTHGIFSKGVEHLKEYYDEIYTTDSIRNTTDGVNTIPFQDLYFYENLHLHGNPW